MQKVKVTIRKRGKIPFIGNGPVLKPIYIPTEVYENLIKLGYPVEKVETVSANAVTKKSEPKAVKINSTVSKEEVLERIGSDKVEEKKEEEKVEVPETKVEEAVATTEPEVIKEIDEETGEEEEILVNDPNFSAGAYYEEKFLKKKDICKAILDAREIEYSTEASLAMLKKLVLESNPDVEFEEE